MNCKQRLDANKVKLEVSARGEEVARRSRLRYAFRRASARALIENEIARVLADEVLFGRLAKGGKVHVDLADDKLAFSYSDTPVGAPADIAGLDQARVRAEAGAKGWSPPIIVSWSQCASSCSGWSIV